MRPIPALVLSRSESGDLNGAEMTMASVLAARGALKIPYTF